MNGLFTDMINCGDKETWAIQSAEGCWCNHIKQIIVHNGTDDGDTISAIELKGTKEGELIIAKPNTEVTLKHGRYRGEPAVTIVMQDESDWNFWSISIYHNKGTIFITRSKQ